MKRMSVVLVALLAIMFLFAGTSWADINNGSPTAKIWRAIVFFYGHGGEWFIYCLQILLTATPVGVFIFCMISLRRGKDLGSDWRRAFDLVIPSSPTVGFLGTVIGLVVAFEQISKTAVVTPALVAKGVGFALVTTVIGLITWLLATTLEQTIAARIERKEGE